jgi:hypothetical protein
MTVAMLIDNPNGSQELYEMLRSELGFDRPLGGKAHVAGPLPDGGWRVIEVWDSVEEASAFLRDRFVPALRAAGFTGEPPQPEFWPVHSVLT